MNLKIILKTVTKRYITMVVWKLKKLVSDAITVLITENVDLLVQKPPLSMQTPRVAKLDKNLKQWISEIC